LNQSKPIQLNPNQSKPIQLNPNQSKPIQTNPNQSKLSPPITSTRLVLLVLRFHPSRRFIAPSLHRLPVSPVLRFHLSCPSYLSGHIMLVSYLPVVTAVRYFHRVVYPVSFVSFVFVLVLCGPISISNASPSSCAFCSRMPCGYEIGCPLPVSSTADRSSPGRWWSTSPCRASGRLGWPLRGITLLIRGPSSLRVPSPSPRQRRRRMVRSLARAKAMCASWCTRGTWRLAVSRALRRFARRWLCACPPSPG